MGTLTGEPVVRALRRWTAVAAGAVVVVETSFLGWRLLRRASRRRARFALEERLRFETLLSDLSAELIDVAASELEGALERGLQQVAVFLNADRGNLDDYADGGTGVRVVWATSGVEKLPPLLDDAQFPWTAQVLRRGHVVRFGRTEELPEAAAADRASYERVGTRSHVSTPLQASGPVLGALSFDCVREERLWPEELVDRLRVLSKAFASALERKRMETSLVERLRFERLLSALAATLSTPPAADFDREVQNALRRLVEALQIHGGCLIEFTRDGKTARSWTVGEAIDVAAFPWTTAQLQHGKVVRTSEPGELPDEAAVDRRASVALGAKPYVAVPLVAGGTVVGGLVFSTTGTERGTPDELVQRLQLLGEVFANALSRKQGELEERRLHRDLMHVGRVSAMGELVGSLAHELNQPLTAILTNAQAAQRLLAAGAGSVDELLDILRDIVADDRRATDVIHGLRLLLSKGDSDRVPLDLNAIVHDVARLVRADAAGRHVSMSLELGVDLPRVRGDRVQLQQAVVNLVLNGLDSIRERGTDDRTLVVRTATDGATAVRLEVQDSGIGIDDRDRGRIFEPFYTTKADGLGMGLAIVRTIVDAHGGRVAADNNPAGGATFRFTLPVHPEDAR